MAHIVDHLPVAELEERCRAAWNATEVRHLQAISPKRAAFAAGLLAQGRSVLDVADVLAFVPRWAEELAARCNAHGPDALGDGRRRNGRAASVLTPALLAALTERLRTLPPPRPRRHPAAHRFPLVATPISAELITRSSYHAMRPPLPSKPLHLADRLRQRRDGCGAPAFGRSA